MLNRFYVLGLFFILVMIPPALAKGPCCEVTVGLREGKEIKFTETNRNCKRFTEQITIYKKGEFNSYDAPVEHMGSVHTIELTGPAREPYEGSMVVTYKDGRKMTIEDARLSTRQGNNLILEYKTYDPNFEKWVKDMVEVKDIQRIVFSPCQDPK